jgi:2-succinyl-6-hydroxy-2,4-cyclohexadiene-1-carboxylate synthase
MTPYDLTSRDGETLHVEVSGAGSPVVLLHGFTGSIAAMGPLAHHLAAVHTVFAVDLLGHGLSSAPRDPDRYQANRLYRDLDEVTLALDLQAPSVVAYSLGARLALGYAGERPGAFSRIAVIGAGLGIEDADERKERAASDEAMAVLIEDVGMAAFVDSWMRQPLIADQAADGSEAWAEGRSRRLAQDPHGVTGMLRGFGKGVMPPFSDTLPALSTPTLAIVGADDAKFLPEAERIVDLVANGRLALVAGAGHAPHVTQTATTADVILTFLSESDPR